LKKSTGTKRKNKLEPNIIRLWDMIHDLEKELPDPVAHFKEIVAQIEC